LLPESFFNPLSTHIYYIYPQIVQMSPQQKQSLANVVSGQFRPTPTPSADILSYLKKCHNPQFYFPVQHAPRFSLLFPNEPLPVAKTDSDIDQSTLNSLIVKRLAFTKLALKKQNMVVPRLPQDYFDHVKTIITSSIVSSQGRKPRPSPVPAKASKPKAPSPLDTQKVLDILKNSESPVFYFNEQPTFPQLFPNTSVPAYTRVSGNVRINPDAFTPLLASRLSSAKKVLAKYKVNLPRLPSSFVQSQIRLISRSVDAMLKNRIAKRKQKRSEKKKTKSKTNSQSLNTEPRSIAFTSSSSVTPTPPPESSTSKLVMDLRPPVGSTAYWMKVRPVLKAAAASLAAVGHVSPDVFNALRNSGCLPLLFTEIEQSLQADDTQVWITKVSSSASSNFSSAERLPSAMFAKSLAYVQSITDLALSSSLSEFSSPYLTV